MIDEYVANKIPKGERFRKVYDNPDCFSEDEVFWALFDFTQDEWTVLIEKHGLDRLQFFCGHADGWLAVLHLKLKPVQDALNTEFGGLLAALVHEPDVVADERLGHLLPHDWEWVLEKRPELRMRAQKFPYGWCAILLNNPALISECYLCEEFDEIIWSSLLQKYPPSTFCDAWISDRMMEMIEAYHRKAFDLERILLEGAVDARLSRANKGVRPYADKIRWKAKEAEMQIDTARQDDDGYYYADKETEIEILNEAIEIIRRNQKSVASLAT